VIPRTLVATRSTSRPASMLLLALSIFVLIFAQAVPSPAQSRPNTFADLVEQVSPAVVNITTTTVIEARSGANGMTPQENPFEGTPFEDFFKDFNDQGLGPQGPQRATSLGSGFVISADGYVVTNNHVIEDADEIMVEFFSGESLPATLIGTDPAVDIALLKVDASDLAFVGFADSDTARVGDWVLAVGNPLGQGFSVSAGIVSARNRELSGTYDDYIQTDAAINRGNSGGPLFNLYGDVIGVNTAILSPNGGSIGIGFSMASNVVKAVVDQLMQYGETRRGWLGVRIQDLSEDMVDAIPGLTSTAGALVTDVPEGPAFDAGIQPGDVILRFNGRDVPDTRALVRMVGAAPVGMEATVDVLRGGDEITFSVTLGRRETAEAAQGNRPAPIEPQNEEILGISLSELTPDMVEKYQTGDAKGVVITSVAPLSDAEDKGLAPGDIITEASQAPLSSISELKDRIGEAQDSGRKSILLKISRGGEPMFVALSVKE
jgi:serine protease Do